MILNLRWRKNSRDKLGANAAAAQNFHGFRSLSLARLIFVTSSVTSSQRLILRAFKRSTVVSGQRLLFSFAVKFVSKSSSNEKQIDLLRSDSSALRSQDK